MENNANIEKEILQLEEKYWKSMQKKDVETAVSLTHFPCIVSSPQGTSQIDEDQYRKLMKNQDTSRFDGVMLDKPQVEVINENVAIINYSLQINGMKMLDVSTWVREEGEWRCAFHSEMPFLEKPPQQ